MAESAYSEKSRKQISRHVRKHRKEGMPQDQAVAAAMSEARRSGKKTPARKGKTKGGRAKAKKGGKKGGSTAQKRKAGRKGGKATARKRSR